MRFSIVIPLHRDTPAFRTCLSSCLELDHPDVEVLVVSDRPANLPDDPRLVAVVSGRGDDSSPAEKRDLAAEKATGEALAYIDDDAYPAPDWLAVDDALSQFHTDDREVARARYRSYIDSGIGLELKAIAAVVVGGVAITGGRGTLIGTMIGVLLLGTIGTALTFAGVNPFWEKAIQGAIILVALVSDVALGRLENNAKHGLAESHA